MQQEHAGNGVRLAGDLHRTEDQKIDRKGSQYKTTLKADGEESSGEADCQDRARSRKSKKRKPRHAACESSAVSSDQ